MKRLFAIILIVVFSLSMVACSDKTDKKHSAVEQYKSVAQQYIDKGDTETAKKALEEGISLTNDEGLKKMLEEISVVEEAEEKEEEEPVPVEEVKEEPTPVEEPKEQPAVVNKPETPKLNMDIDTVNAYISGKKSFVDFDSKQEATIKTLPNVNSNYGGGVGRYAVVDLDGDNVKELVVEYNLRGDTAVLHIQNNSCVAYYVPCRGILGLKVDGTTDYSNSAFESGIQKFTFSDSGISSRNIVTFNDETNVYMVEGKSVTRDECLDVLGKQNSKEDVMWNYLN